MSIKKALALALICAPLLACAYIVLPEGAADEGPTTSKGWSAIVTNVGKSDSGDLHMDVTIRNETNDWSSMKAVEGKPAVLKSGGTSTDCETVFVSTGGHRLAPGFQMRGYIGGTKAEPVRQLLYVECKGAEAAAGSTLSIDYVYYTGMLNYFDQEANNADGTMVLNLDEIVTDLTYPVAMPVEGFSIQKADAPILAINDNSLTLSNIERTDTSVKFTWKNVNPSQVPLKVHIGIPPVIGADGIIYGIFRIMDLESPPVTPAGGEAEWETEQAVPADVTGLYLLLSFEFGKQRQYANAAIDITDK